MKEAVEGLASYDFVLPDDRVAQEPPEVRGGERSDVQLLVLDCGRDVVEHHSFKGLGEFFRSNDVLALNNTRVVPSLLHGKDVNGRNAVVVVFSPMENGTWHCLALPEEVCRTGSTFSFGDGSVTGRLLHREGPTVWRIALMPQRIDSLYGVAQYRYPPYLRQAPKDLSPPIKRSTLPGRAPPACHRQAAISPMR